MTNNSTPDPASEHLSSIANALQTIARLLERADLRAGEEHHAVWELKRLNHREMALINTGFDTAHQVHLYTQVRSVLDDDGHAQYWSGTSRTTQAWVSPGEDIKHAFYEDGQTSLKFEVEVDWKLTWQSENGARHQASSGGFVRVEMSES